MCSAESFANSSNGTLGGCNRGSRFQFDHVYSASILCLAICAAEKYSVFALLHAVKSCVGCVHDLFQTCTLELCTVYFDLSPCVLSSKEKYF